MIKINLASGQRPFPKPWVNVDVKDQGYAVDILTDAKTLDMFEDESVDIIVAQHLVEHIPIHELDEYITEWRRVLKAGGILSVQVPNLYELDKAWIEGRIDTYIHNVNTYGAYQNSIHDTHKWGYNWQELVDRLSGWDGNSRKYEWSEVSNYIDIFHNTLYTGADISRDWWILEGEFKK